MLESLLSWTQLPNLHPLAVHFPIALVPVALLLDLVALAWGRQEWLGRAAGMVYGLAGVAAVVALELGERAADSLRDVPPELQPHIALHSDWGHWTAWAVGGLAVVRVAMLFLAKAERHIGLRIAVLVLGLGALGVLARAADLGGGLVYGHGLGVARGEDEHAHAPEGEDATIAGAEAQEVEHRGQASLERRQDGSFTWRPAHGDREALGTVLQPATGSSIAAVTVAADEGEGLTLLVEGRTLLVFPGSFGDLQLDAELDLGGFVGTVGLAHHVLDGSTYRSFRVDRPASEVGLVTVNDGATRSLDRSSAEIPARAHYAVSVAGRHLKGLIDGATVTHGHEPAPDPGSVGLLLDGEGKVVIRSVVLTVL